MVGKREQSAKRGAPVLWTVTVAICGVFLAVTSYMTLREAVTPQADAPATGDLEMRVEDWKRRTPGELSDAYKAAAEAFAREPLDAENLVNLAHIAEAKGDAETSERLKLAAGEIRPRSARIQAEALAVLVERRDFVPLMSRLDGLLRARPGQSEVLFGIAADLASEPEARRILAQLLTENPPWRANFLAYLLVTKNAPQLAQAVIADIRAAGGGTDPTEVTQVIDNYLRSGATDKAYYVWLDTLSPDELKSVKGVYDGGFNHPVRSMRFDWTFKPAKGYAYRIFPRNTASMDKTLQIDFLDFEGNFSHLSQLIRLVPGRYRLSGEVRSENLQPDNNLVFRLYCLSPAGERLVEETNPLPQSGQWIGFEKTVNVPEVECSNQILRLESLATTSGFPLLRGQICTG